MAAMDPNPSSFPILSYVMSRLPHLGAATKSPTSPSSPSAAATHDLEQPPILDHLPHLHHPKLLAAMTLAVADVAQTRSLLQTLGPRPDHELVDASKARIIEIESDLGLQLEQIVLSPRPEDVERLEWRGHLADKEQEARAAAEKERQACKAVVQLEEMHVAYEKLLKEAEDKLVRIYDSASRGGDGGEEAGDGGESAEEGVNEEVVGILQEASGKEMERVDLSGKMLRSLPEAFGRLKGLLVLNLASNQLVVRFLAVLLIVVKMFDWFMYACRRLAE